MLKLELTEQEAGALQQLLDIAVKAGGINVAPAALAINAKLVEAAKAAAAAGAAGANP